MCRNVKLILLVCLVIIVAASGFGQVSANVGVVQLAPAGGSSRSDRVSTRSPQPNTNTIQAVAQQYGDLPLTFELNQGQTDAEVKFVSRGHGYTLFLTPHQAVLALTKSGESKGRKQLLWRPSPPHGTASNRQPTVLRIELVGANDSPRIVGTHPQTGTSNYFIGNIPKKWRTNIPQYARVRYRDVYPGIDLVYYGKQRQLEYDFVVGPGVNPSQIRLQFEGADQLRINEKGDLVLRTAAGELLQCKPLIYQDVRGVRGYIAGKYQLAGNNQVSFNIGPYDRTKTIVIDPVLSYSTFLGGSDSDVGNAVAVDSFGRAYVTGFTASLDFPTKNPRQSSNRGSIDVFVTKLWANGSGIHYSTYLGGSSDDGGFGIALDSSGRAYVTGLTTSPDFPTKMAFQSKLGEDPEFGADAFVSKLSSSGSSLLYSTYLGGKGEDFGNDIALDSRGRAYVIGRTNSLADFPVTSGAFQPQSSSIGSEAFVTKFWANGAGLHFSTYLGGSGEEEGLGITIDSRARAYVTGTTDSPDFPTTPGAFQTSIGGPDADVFVTKLWSNGAGLHYSTYLGGSGFDFGLGVDVDSSNHAYVTGGTSSFDFPTTPGAFKRTHIGFNSEPFVTKLNFRGSGLIYSTLLGTRTETAPSAGFSIAVDSSGRAHVAGTETAESSSGDDAFVAKLWTNGGGLHYRVYLHGSNADGGFGIALDSSANAYVTGFTFSEDFRVSRGAFQKTKKGVHDAFVIKLRP